MRICQTVLGVGIDVISWDLAVARILAWGQCHESRYIALCNVHSVVTATRDATFMDTINGADLAAPDGAPIAWAVQRLGKVKQARVNGPDLMWRLLTAAQHSGQSVFLYGSTELVLRELRDNLARHFPALLLAGTCAPPFRDLSRAEDEAIVADINRSGANLVFVGLGCPKQERWMASHQGRIGAVMLGVGAAFDYHAGLLRRAPLWWQTHGLEWLYRLGVEPRRLAMRYLCTNTVFVLAMARQLLRLATRGRP